MHINRKANEVLREQVKHSLYPTLIDTTITLIKWRKKKRGLSLLHPLVYVFTKKIALLEVSQRI